ncbi:hypothetical protein M0805_004355 [Coniferiporia weirii]|nr:hypothetical protein M0805_004355 [Coniferiporia weirii]
MHYVDVLILGAGWTSDFLIPLLRKSEITFAATTRDGRARSDYSTIKFVFDPESEDSTPFEDLPDARTVVISFPIYKSGASERLVRNWKKAHKDTKVAFAQLGSTGIWNGDPTLKGKGDQAIWCDRHSTFDASNERARAEVELLRLTPDTPATVLNLSGLWGGQRHPRNWLPRVAKTKEALAQKGSLHLIHGVDVARAILAVHQNFPASAGQRWLLTDCRVYDWWDLASAWGEVSDASSALESKMSEGAHESKDDTVSSSTANPAPLGSQAAWVRALMAETGVRGLPRPPGALERALDSREFWDTFGISPAKTLLAP